MAMRRAHGEGTIYQRPDDLWVAQITLPDGKRKTKYSKTQKVVKEWLFEQRKALRDGVWVKDDNLTVSAFFSRFMSDVVKNKVRPKTFDSYSTLLRIHVEPAIGHIRLVDLRPYHLQDLYSQKVSSGLSNRTVQYIHAVIRRGLKQAYKWGIVSRNIAELVEAPRPARKELRIFSVEQSKQFLEALKDDRLYSFYALAIGCGLRLGELLALNWEDINFEISTLSVRRNLQRVRGKTIIGEPKSDKSRRNVAIPSFVLEDLKKNRRNEGLIFTTSNGTAFSPRNIQRHFANTLVKLGLPKIRFHDLRHTFASIMFAQNIHPKTVQEALGHSSISLTLDTYSHMIPTLQKEAAEKLDGVLRS